MILSAKGLIALGAPVAAFACSCGCRPVTALWGNLAEESRREICLVEAPLIAVIGVGGRWRSLSS